MSITLRGLADLANRALQHGATHVYGANAIEWDVKAYCETPVNRTLHCRDYKRGAVRKYKWSVNPGSLTLHLQGLPCRKCKKCLYVKQSEWTDRILREMAMTDRNWFVTLTLNPETHHRTFMEALADRNERGWRDTDFDHASDEWKLRCEGVSKLLTDYLKRVRKPLAGETPVSFRYVAVTEPHKNGLPHLHLIMSERAGNLTYRRICDRWTRNGFADASLVRDPVGAGAYVAKYITKNSQTRIRASLRFGQLPGEEDMDDLYRNVVRLIGLADQSEGTERNNPLEEGLSPVGWQLQPQLEKSFNAKLL